MASHDPSTYQFSTVTYIIMYSTLLTAYYVLVLYPLHLALLTLALHSLQLGYIYGAEESIQDADARHHRVSEDFPPASWLRGEEPYIYPDRAWVRHFFQEVCMPA